jgi:hypothetical protein
MIDLDNAHSLLEGRCITLSSKVHLVFRSPGAESTRRLTRRWCDHVINYSPP